MKGGVPESQFRAHCVVANGQRLLPQRNGQGSVFLPSDAAEWPKVGVF